MFWLTFPVYKVDDIAMLQHVSLLLDQFGHVDHCAISATNKQTNKQVIGCVTVQCNVFASLKYQNIKKWNILNRLIFFFTISVAFEIGTDNAPQNWYYSSNAMKKKSWSNFVPHVFKPHQSWAFILHNLTVLPWYQFVGWKGQITTWQQNNKANQWKYRTNTQQRLHFCFSVFCLGGCNILGNIVFSR